MTLFQITEPGRVRYDFGCMNVMLMGRQNWANTKLPRSTGRMPPEIMSFHFQIKGQQNLGVGSQNHLVHAGEVFVTFSGEHISIAQEKGMFYWLQMRVPRHDSFLDLPGTSDEALKRALWRLKPRQFHASTTIHRLLEEIHQQCQTEPSPLFVGWIYTQIAQLMFEIVACARQAATTHASALQPIVRYIAEAVESHREAPLTIPALAARARLSVPGFEKKFKQELGIPPAEYVLRVKMEEAKRQLARGLRVTEVAMTLNLSSSQHFATVFKRYTGQTPSDFQKHASVKSS